MKKIKQIFIGILFLMQLTISGFSENNDSLKIYENYKAAFDDLSYMLNDSTALNFEEAIFAIENAYHNNELSKADYTNKLNFHTARIIQLASANANKLTEIIAENNNPSGIETNSVSNRKKLAEHLLLNWAIFTYLTDTTWWKEGDNYVAHYPIQYEIADPFGNSHWENTMVTNLLLNPTLQGNCFSLAALYYIFSQRLHTEAYLSTAPNHIFIQHIGMDETYYNVELTTHSFPGSGTIKTFTYTSHKAISKGIAMKRLTEKEAIALCAVYLAKGYAKKLRIKNGELRMDGFALSCSALALSFDSLCLSAMLLKQEILAANTNNSDALLAIMKNLRENGYEQMPNEMHNAIVAEIQHKKESPNIYTSSPFEAINKSRNYFSLSKNKYPEMKTSGNDLYQVGNVCLNNTSQEINYISENNLAISEMNDPVVFAMSVDPLAAKYASESPYEAMGNNPVMFVDPDGRDIHYYEVVTTFDKEKQQYNSYYELRGTESSDKEVYVATYQSFDPDIDNQPYTRTVQANSMGELIEAVESDKKFVYVSNIFCKGFRNIGDEEGDPFDGLNNAAKAAGDQT